MRVYIRYSLSLSTQDFALLVVQRGGVGEDKSAGFSRDTGTQMGTLDVDDLQGATCWVCCPLLPFPVELLY